MKRKTIPARTVETCGSCPFRIYNDARDEEECSHPTILRERYGKGKTLREMYANLPDNEDPLDSIPETCPLDDAPKGKKAATPGRLH